MRRGGKKKTIENKGPLQTEISRKPIHEDDWLAPKQAPKQASSLLWVNVDLAFTFFFFSFFFGWKNGMGGGKSPL